MTDPREPTPKSQAQPDQTKPDQAKPVLPAGMPMIRTIAMPADTNPAGDIFGGWLMAQMDLAAGNAAFRRARGRCVTIAADAMAFLSPVKVGDEVSFYAILRSVGRTSMKFDVEAWRRPRDLTEPVQVTQAIFTFVAIDESGRPRPVPEEVGYCPMP